MRDPGKSRFLQTAEVLIGGHRIGLVIVDEFFEIPDTFDVCLGDHEPMDVVQFAMPGLVCEPKDPRILRAKPWLRQKKGRGAQR
ncbi:hypothetical protein [Pseudomonas fluorescens]|uniref:Uncharacterized protein n=1 Tax=Pseudomonas fluorescens TaxID=294 RepID=A0A5E7A838_PSEFL|nr:hypothetical protein [Pseudomonas fluorescens]VVN74285.1 hypothetical protein PS710_00640 [Pseudomonas fluorescens]